MKKNTKHSLPDATCNLDRYERQLIEETCELPIDPNPPLLALLKRPPMPLIPSSSQTESITDAVSPSSLHDTSATAPYSDGIESADRSTRDNLTSLEAATAGLVLSTHQPSEGRQSSSDFFDADLLHESSASQASLGSHDDDDFFEASVLPSADAEEAAETAAETSAAAGLETSAAVPNVGKHDDVVNGTATAHSSSKTCASSAEAGTTAGRAQRNSRARMPPSRSKSPVWRGPHHRPEAGSGAMSDVPEGQDGDDDDEAWLVIADDGLPEGAVRQTRLSFYLFYYFEIIYPA